MQQWIPMSSVTRRQFPRATPCRRTTGLGNHHATKNHQQNKVMKITTLLLTPATASLLLEPEVQ